MARLTNNTVWPVPLPNGLALEPRQSRDVSNGDLDAPDMARALPAMIAAGDVSVSRDPEEAPQISEPEAVKPRFAEEMPAPETVPEDPPEAAPVPETLSADDAEIEKGA